MSLMQKAAKWTNNTWRLYVRGELPTAIYSAGRVGSTALLASLEAAGVFAFKPEMIAEEGQRKQYGNAAWFYDHVLQQHRPARIITIVRDPMAQMVTEFFSKLRWITGEEGVWKRRSTAELIDLFNGAYFEQGRHHTRLNWFEAEFQQTLHIDAYAHPFDTEQGYARFTAAPYDILLVQLEISNEAREQIIGDFLGVPGLRIVRVNESEAKSYAEAYAAFKRQLVVTPQNLDTVYTSRYATHFYSAAFIAQRRDHWGSPRA